MSHTIKKIIHNNEPFKLYQIHEINISDKEFISMIYVLKDNSEDRTDIINMFLQKIINQGQSEIIKGQVLVLFKDQLEDPSEIPEYFLGGAVGYSLRNDINVLFKSIWGTPLIGYV